GCRGEREGGEHGVARGGPGRPKGAGHRGERGARRVRARPHSRGGQLRVAHGPSGNGGPRRRLARALPGAGPGGRAKWEAEGRELSFRPPSYPRGNFEVKTINSHLRVRLADVLDVVTHNKDVAILDIRSPAEYEGRIFAPEGFQELAIRAGHIPGAVNVPWSQAVNPDGTFKSKEELRFGRASCREREDTAVDGRASRRKNKP